MTDTARINITVSRDIHKAARLHAVEHGMTLSQVVTRAIERLVLDGVGKRGKGRKRGPS